MQIVYKVVYQNKDGLYESCCRNSYFPNKYRLYYKLNEITTPIKNTKIFCFDTLYNATFFQKTFDLCENQHMPILQCVAQNVSQPDLVVIPYYIDDFWKTKDIYKLEYQLIPKGTLWCDQLLPIRVV